VWVEKLSGRREEVEINAEGLVADDHQTLCRAIQVALDRIIPTG
jgi:hypothetical protein